MSFSLISNTHTLQDLKEKKKVHHTLQDIIKIIMPEGAMHQSRDGDWRVATTWCNVNNALQREKTQAKG